MRTTSKRPGAKNEKTPAYRPLADMKTPVLEHLMKPFFRGRGELRQKRSAGGRGGRLDGFQSGLQEADL